MVFIRIIIALFLLPLLSLNVFGGNRFLRIPKVSYWYGGSRNWVERYAISDNLDFLNYIENDNPRGFNHFGISTIVGISNSFMLDLKASSAETHPFNLNLALQYFLHPNFGLQGGIYTHSYVVGDYKQYFSKDFSEYYLIPYAFSSYDGFGLQDIGAIFGAVYRVNYGLMHFEGKVSIGYGQVSPFSTVIAQKRKDSNFRRELEYNVHPKTHLFVLPEINLGADILKFEKSTFGIEVMLWGYLSQRSFDYELTEKNWINSNYNITSVINPQHRFGGIITNVSMFWRF